MTPPFACGPMGITDCNSMLVLCYPGLPPSCTDCYQKDAESSWGEPEQVADCTWDVHTGYSSSQTTMAKPAWAKLTMIRKLPCALPTYST